jgi:transcriptional regulator with XRE-family HTH domain
VPVSVEDLQKEIGRRIRDARISADLTQEAAALSCGMDYKRFQRLELGAVNPTIKTLARVAKGLGSDFWTLLGATPPTRKPKRSKPLA